jgi:hypothetical protein
MDTRRHGYSLTLCIVCFIAALLICSCSPEKTDTGNVPGQSGERAAGEAGAGPAETGPSTSQSNAQGEKDTEAMSVNKPKVDRAMFLLETIGGIDVLKIAAEGSDREGKKASLRYEWTKNGEPAGEGDSFRRFRRGDRISVRITPFDEKGPGFARTMTTEIRNTTPRIVEHQKVGFDGKVWSYQVNATDADGDTLTYSLKKAPQGMTIGVATGLITWEVPPRFSGKAPVTVSVTDGHGGEATYSFDAIMSITPR